MKLVDPVAPGHDDTLRDRADLMRSTLANAAPVFESETWCQICGVDTVPPAAYCPACDAVLASGGVE